MTGLLSSRIHKFLNFFIAFAAALFVISGLYIGIWQGLIFTEVRQYGQNVCASLEVARTDHSCIYFVDSKVTAAYVVNDDSVEKPYVQLMVPGVSSQPITELITRPDKDFYKWRAENLVQKGGEPVLVKLWRQRITGVFITPENGMRTEGNPFNVDELRLSGGVFVLAMGGILLLVSLPNLGIAIFSFHTRWHHADDLESRLAYSALHRMRVFPLLGIAFAVYLILQLLDIITSIVDGQSGFFEANPLAAELINQFGAYGGFIGLKLPALIALFLGISRLPWRLAFVVTTAGVAVMVYIVGQNLALLASGHGLQA